MEVHKAKSKARVTLETNRRARKDQDRNSSVFFVTQRGKKLCGIIEQRNNRCRPSPQPIVHTAYYTYTGPVVMHTCGGPGGGAAVGAWQAWVPSTGGEGEEAAAGQGQAPAPRYCWGPEMHTQTIEEHKPI